MEKRISKENFKEISIRARVAYSICCLENALVHYKKNISEWKELLDLLWEFPQHGSYINEPPEKWIDYLPRTLDEYPFEEMQNAFPVEIYNYYRQLYLWSEKPILNIVNLIQNIAAEELYAGIPKYSPETLNILQQILDIMQENTIPLPDIAIFKQFQFEVKPITEYGWGYPFNGKSILSRFS